MAFPKMPLLFQLGKAAKGNLVRGQGHLPCRALTINAEIARSAANDPFPYHQEKRLAYIVDMQPFVDLLASKAFGHRGVVRKNEARHVAVDDVENPIVFAHNIICRP